MVPLRQATLCDGTRWSFWTYGRAEIKKPWSPPGWTSARSPYGRRVGREEGHRSAPLFLAGGEEYGEEEYSPPYPGCDGDWHWLHLLLKEREGLVPSLLEQVEDEVQVQTQLGGQEVILLVRHRVHGNGGKERAVSHVEPGEDFGLAVEFHGTSSGSHAAPFFVGRDERVTSRHATRSFVTLLHLRRLAERVTVERLAVLTCLPRGRHFRDLRVRQVPRGTVQRCVTREVLAEIRSNERLADTLGVLRSRERTCESVGCHVVTSLRCVALHPAVIVASGRDAYAHMHHVLHNAYITQHERNITSRHASRVRHVARPDNNPPIPPPGRTHVRDPRAPRAPGIFSTTESPYRSAKEEQWQNQLESASSRMEQHHPPQIGAMSCSTTMDPRPRATRSHLWARSRPKWSVCIQASATRFHLEVAEHNSTSAEGSFPDGRRQQGSTRTVSTDAAGSSAAGESWPALDPGQTDEGTTVNGPAPRSARPRDVRGVGFPSSEEPLYGGRTLNALSRQVETPFPGLDSETRRRVEQFIGCTVEQSYSEFTVELKNAVHRFLDELKHDDQSKPARHRGGAWARKARSRRVG